MVLQRSPKEAQVKLRMVMCCRSIASERAVMLDSSYVRTCWPTANISKNIAEQSVINKVNTISVTWWFLCC